MNRCHLRSSLPFFTLNLKTPIFFFLSISFSFSSPSVSLLYELESAANNHYPKNVSSPFSSLSLTSLSLSLTFNTTSSSPETPTTLYHHLDSIGSSTQLTSDFFLWFSLWFSSSIHDWNKSQTSRISKYIGNLSWSSWQSKWPAKSGRRCFSLCQWFG